MNINNTENRIKGKTKIMAILNILMGIIFLFLFLTFFLPIFGGVLNAGNILGMIFCAFMLFATFGNSIFSKIIADIKTRLLGKIIVYAVSVIFVLGIIYVVILTCFIVSADKTPPKDDCTVIVLGCQVRGDQPSLMLMERIKTARDYLNEHPDVPCIVTGGKGDEENLSEARCMYNNLVSMGISPERIYIEDKAVNTVENIEFSKKIIEQNELSKNTAIVTDIFHEYRASQIVKNANLQYGSVSADCVWYLIPTFYVRELAAITAKLIGIA